jgi:hypothetical protein
VAGVGFSDGDKGDITISSSGTVLTIANDAVTYAKIQNVSATDRLLGRSSAGAGDVEEITCTSFGRSLIDDANAEAARTTLSVQPTAGPSFTAGITVTQASAAPTVVLRNTTADATDKAAQVVGAHYTATEETVQGIGIYSTATENLVAIGGGSALSNAASEVRLYTAANTTTTTGTTRLTISSTGTATFAGQIVGQAGAAITGAATFENSGNVVPLTVTNAGTANSFVVNDASGDSDPFVIDAAGRIAIGATAAFSDSHKFAILGGLPSSAGVTAGFVLRVLVPSSSTNNFISCLSNIGTEAASYTVNSLEHYAAAQQSLGAGSAIGSQYGFVARDSLTGATNNFGFWSNIASGTGRWNFYANGTAPNYFGGQVTVASPVVLTGTVAGNVRQLRMQTSGSTRWEVGPGFDAESGSNVGSTLWITRWSDAGAFLGTPIAIDRATGNVTLENQLTVSSGMSVTGTVLVGISTAFDSTSNIQIGAASNPGIGIARTATPSNTNSIAGINGTAYDGAAYVAGGTINWRANENWSSTNHGTDIQFRATPAGNGGALTEVLRITGGGQTLVTAGSGSSGSYKPGLAISGDDDTGIHQVSGNANTLSIVTNGTERVRVKATGAVRFVPLAADPASGNEAGDVYYNSSTNKLRVYNGTSWVDLH